MPTLKDCIFLAVGASFRRDLGKAFQIGTTQAGKALSELEFDLIGKPVSNWRECPGMLLVAKRVGRDGTGAFGGRRERSGLRGGR